jgi:protoporphyrinogen IX oxidase
MTGWLGDAYPWVKAAHVIVVIFWMAGLFMLPRFYAYHQETARESPEWTMWLSRESRLIRIILNPAMIAVWALGLALVININAARETWFLAKFAAVVLLTVYHFWMVGYARRFNEPTPRLVANRTMRLLNEVPGLVAITAVILVIVQPF